jgi:uncharacterized protein YuzE
MRIHYDREADAVYISLGNQKPDGVIEISEGVIWTPPKTIKS